jgi:hypothetical protein
MRHPPKLSKDINEEETAVDDNFEEFCVNSASKIFKAGETLSKGEER